jgi:hypothetical protein
MVHGDCIEAFIVPLKSQLGSARLRNEGALRLRPRRGRHAIGKIVAAALVILHFDHARTT